MNNREAINILQEVFGRDPLQVTKIKQYIVFKLNLKEGDTMAINQKYKVTGVICINGYTQLAMMVEQSTLTQYQQSL